MEMIYVGIDTENFKNGESFIVSLNLTRKETPETIRKIGGAILERLEFEWYSQNFIHPSHYEQECAQKPECIYQVGDTVYHFFFGLGRIAHIAHIDVHCPIKVKFDNHEEEFTIDGKYFTSDKEPSLSFTPYDLKNGGFSQERPKPEPKIGDVGYFWNDENFLCAYAEIEHISRGSTFEFKPKNADYFKNFSHEPPAHIKQ